MSHFCAIDYKSPQSLRDRLRLKDPLVNKRCTLSAAKSQEAKIETDRFLWSIPFFASFVLSFCSDTIQDLLSLLAYDISNTVFLETSSRCWSLLVLHSFLQRHPPPMRSPPSREDLGSQDHQEPNTACVVKGEGA